MNFTRKIQNDHDTKKVPVIKITIGGNTVWLTIWQAAFNIYLYVTLTYLFQ